MERKANPMRTSKGGAGRDVGAMAAADESSGVAGGVAFSAEAGA
jgi:hypothetical protein